MKALIVEDEALAVENLICYLKDFPLEIIGSADNISDALTFIEKNKPEVVFLDINLSGENGFDLLERTNTFFETIFVTAYDEYAVRAFEINALDYILKPLKKDRIEKAINRLLKNTHDVPARQRYNMNDSIFLSNGCQASFIKLRDICYIEADSCYTKIILNDNNKKVLPKTLKKWEELLPPEEFVRVHRSYIINITQIKNINKKLNSTYEVSFNNTKERITISRRYSTDLRKKMLSF